MSLDDVRVLAAEAVRMHLYACSIDPVTVTAENASVVLESMTCQNPVSEIAQWYQSASSYDLRLFSVEWAIWCAEQKQERQVSEESQQRLKKHLPLGWFKRT